MLKVKKIQGKENVSGIAVVFLWVFAISVVHTIEKGDHFTLGLCIGPCELNIGTSLWRKMLP